MRSGAAAVALAVLIGGSLAGCSDDAEPVTLAVEASSPEAGRYAFDMPEEMDGGVVELTLTNVDEEPHELGMIRLPDGLTADDFKAVLSSDGGPIPDDLEGAGIGTIAPGQTLSATQELEPGTWVYFCSFGDEVSHYDAGMYGTVEVKGTKGGGDLPEAAGSITTDGYDFVIEGLTAGTNEVAFTNGGPEQYHHALLAPLADGASVDDVTAFFASEGEPEGPPPLDFEKSVSTAVLAPGQEQVIDLTLDAGEYVVLCFLNDKGGGPPHAIGNGMITSVTVT